MGSNVKKARVSWPSDSMLCQVKMFQKEDYPAKVGAQTCSKSKASKDLHHGTVYSTRPPNIPLITWKPPPKFILSDHWLVASGEESTETGSENLRIAKVLEAFYPHHSLIPPTRPSISPAAVQVDDTITPTIRLTPIEEDEDEQPESPAIQSSQSSKTPPSQFGHGPDMTLAALLNTKEQGSPVDADLLVKFLTDPIIINNLLNAAAAKPLLETGNNNNTTKPPPQHVTTSSANSPPGNGVTPVLAAHLVLNTYPLSCARKPLPRVEESLEPSSVVVSEPQNQSSPTSGTWNMSRVLESAGTVTDTQSAYQMNITRDDYFKNLIREHGGVVAPATNKYKRRVANNNNNNNNDEKKALAKGKGQRPCMFFGKGKGCKLGESCLYLHDPSKRLSTYDVAGAAAAPRAKRLKFRT
ncbi:zinc finger CCCH domain-containing protein 68 isoform X1 [Raphanus sativus]|uniref:Zinc finger CCCH domain-containing protein 68 isoform X1 n=2 Tax=Raphanus sativus TaxID=3726 RepID=A0A6J0K196_RAPSA|nr:zinc finger CCCH domain-containing protein 68 isoform X1 [Raphanus sativus]